MTPLFKPKVFGKNVSAAIARRGLSLRQAEKQIKVSRATLSRVCRGLSPSVEVYLRLTNWIARNP